MSHSGNLNPPSANSSNELGAALRNWRVLAIVFVCLAIVFIYGYIQRADAAAQLEIEISQMRENIESAHLRTAVLEEELRYAASDVYLDRIAREELGLAKPGETALIVINAEAAPAVDAVGQAANVTGPNTTTGDAANLNAAQFRAAPEVLHNSNSAAEPAPLWQAWLDLFTSPARP